MKRLVLVYCLAAAAGLPAQTIAVPTAPPAAAPAPKPVAPANAPTPNAGLQATVDRLNQTNAELLDLLKRQQAVLEDIQYDRRLQNRQIQLVEGRLEDTLQLNATLQAKIAELEADAKAGRAAPAAASTNAATTPPESAPPAPKPPASHLPPPETGGAPGTLSWHRLFTLSGDSGKTSEPFRIGSRQWRVLWHNQDKPGDVYKNTSALFISAFPKDDAIPKKVCFKLGTGGDATELIGLGEFTLKIESSGGDWELAVEEFR